MRSCIAFMRKKNHEPREYLHALWLNMGDNVICLICEWDSSKHIQRHLIAFVWPLRRNPVHRALLMIVTDFDKWRKTAKGWKRSSMDYRSTSLCCTKHPFRSLQHLQMHRSVWFAFDGCDTYLSSTDQQRTLSRGWGWWRRREVSRRDLTLDWRGGSCLEDICNAATFFPADAIS